MIPNTIQLNSGKWRAEICPSLGGNVVCLTFDGANVLCPLVSEEQFRENPYMQGSPILMPANRTHEGAFSFEGKLYTLTLNEPRNNCNLHGSVLFAEFERVFSNENCAVVRLVDESGEYYPFPFAITVTYSLSEAGLTSVYEIENIGEQNMPLTFCLHTTFTEPERFSVPIDLCQEKDIHHIPTGRYVALNDDEQEIAKRSTSRGRIISGYYRSCGNTASIGDYRYEVSGNFDHWVLFNGRGVSGLLCVEPQCGKVNGLNMSDGHAVISPGESIRFETRITKK